ncbi:hypothetical protein LSM04_004013 [Trypanosoma melophagium]|uniref:uncharacterized protein n=1 Tax=Trypanosoma melophagium TaxID=715481 RepID=UPI00351A0543|nr:hypothetical protein LSM04_004013 [Trypanosoma melophagium]
MRPSEIDPLTSLHGPNATPRDLICSSSTFFLWEQLYGVASVSPVPNRILLYHMKDEQNQKKTDRPIIEHSRNRLWTDSSSEEIRKNDFLADTPLNTESTRVYTRSDGHEPSSRRTEKSPQTNKKNSIGRSDSFVFENVYRKIKQTSEAKKDVSSTDKNSQTGNCSDDNHTFQADNMGFLPPLPQPLPSFDLSAPSSSAFPNVGVTRSPRGDNVLFSGSSYRTLAEDLTFVFSTEPDKRMDTRNQLIEEVEDIVDGNGICSELSVVLNPEANDEGGGFASAHHIGGGSSGGSKSHYPVPDPTRLTGAPVSQQLHWETPVEAQRLADNEEVCSEIVGDESVGIDKDPEKVGERGSEHKGRNVTKEDFSIFSAGRRDYFAVNGSPSSEFPKSRLFSASPLRPRQMFWSETPPRRSRDGSEIKLLSPLQCSVKEAPKGRVRRYNPPSFSCTGPHKDASALTGMYELLHSSGVNKDTMSSGALDSPTTEVMLKSTSIVSIHPQGPSPTPATKYHPPPAPTSPLPEPAEQLPKEPFISPKQSVSPSKSPEAAMDNELRLSKKNTTPNRQDDPSVTKKLVSTSLGVVNANCTNCQEQLKETKSMGATRETVLSVSPPPSYKDYEWATKAEEELEQQRKRRIARTPSANSLSPPPPKVSVFEQPHPPKGRAAAQRNLLEGKGENKKVTAVATTEQKQQESQMILDGILTSVKDSSTRESKPSCVQSNTPVENSVERKRGRTTVADARSVAKRARRGTVSPPTTVEFPLPRDVGVNRAGKEKRGKGGNRRGRK